MPGGNGRPLIVPVFIPNAGCPHRCVYCDQEAITVQAAGRIPSSGEIRRLLRQATRSPRFPHAPSKEIAFYGGTFTGLPPGRIRELLDAVKPFCEEGGFDGIRVSTRPDQVDPGILDLIGGAGVTTVELGAQSMHDGVLLEARRGHSARDTVEAVRRLQGAGFRVGIQLMPGLPGETPQIFLSGVDYIRRLRPDMVRLYPTVPLQGTLLGRWYLAGRYRPWSLAEAVSACAEGCALLEGDGIPVIRMGLMASPALLAPGRILGGPWHPAFGFLVRSRIYRRRISSVLRDCGGGGILHIRVPLREAALLRGHAGEGIAWLRRISGAAAVRIETDPELVPGQIRIRQP